MLSRTDLLKKKGENTGDNNWERDIHIDLDERKEIRKKEMAEAQDGGKPRPLLRE